METKMRYLFSTNKTPSYSKMICGCLKIPNLDDVSTFNHKSNAYNELGHIFMYDFTKSLVISDASLIYTFFNDELLSKVLYDIYGGQVPVFDIKRNILLVNSKSNFTPNEEEIIQMRSIVPKFTNTLNQDLEIDKALQVRLALQEHASNGHKSEDKLYLTEEDFLKFEIQKSISIPNDIKYFYKRIGLDKPNDFYRTVKQDTANTKYEIQIEAKLALQLVKNYFLLSPDYITEVSKQIELYDTEKERQVCNSDIEYILIEGVRLYELKNNRFLIPFIQKTYEELGSDKYLLKIIIGTWAHCGGWGGIIVDGKNKSFDGGGPHSHFLEIEYKGENYEYNSNFYARAESHHLFNFLSKSADGFLKF